MNYYLPTADKLLDATTASWIGAPLAGREHPLGDGQRGRTTVGDDRRRLRAGSWTALYRDEAFDMDDGLYDVLETMLAGEGLAKGSDLTDKDDDSQKIQRRNVIKRRKSPWLTKSSSP